MKKPVQQNDIKKQISLVKTSLIFDLVTILPVIIVAIQANSLVLLSDVFDYVLNITTSVISVLILRRCLKNETGNYNFGFGKFESLGALVTSILILVGLIFLAIEAIKRIVDTVLLDSPFITIGIFLQAIGLAISTYLWYSTYKQSKASLSPIMEAQWRINRTNALGNATVILSLVLGIVFKNYPWAAKIDPVTTILLVLLTGNSFTSLIKNSLSDLLDHTLEENLQFKILRYLAEYEDGYERLYDIRSRKSGSKIFIDILLGFDPSRKLGDALDISGRIKERLENDIKGSEVNIVIRSIEEFYETLQKTDSGMLIPITKDYLDSCIDIAKKVFPKDDIEKIKLELMGSIYPNLYADELKAIEIEKPRYWVCIDDNVSIGFIGIKYRCGDNDAVWGGWMAVNPDIKSTLKTKLRFIWKGVFEARQTGRKYFRLYTTTLITEKEDNLLYDKVGLNIFKIESSKDFDILYRQIDLVDLYEMLRPGKNKQYRPAEKL